MISKEQVCWVCGYMSDPRLDGIDLPAITLERQWIKDDLCSDCYESELRYLGWKQPFATLMLHGKDETRTWPTDYRGLVLITASKIKYQREALKRICGPVQLERIWSIVKDMDSQKHLSGHAIAVGRLVDCMPMQDSGAIEDKCFVRYQKELWRHIYEDVRPIEPLPYKGAQGWRKLKRGFIATLTPLNKT